VIPLNAWALAYSAYAELQLRKFDDALTHARKAHEVGDKGLSSAHIVAALALESTGQADKAAGEYRIYLKEDPNGRDAARAKEKLANLNSRTL
jgi:tetratricopeptide (TPR) repeat protein